MTLESLRHESARALIYVMDVFALIGSSTGMSPSSTFYRGPSGPEDITWLPEPQVPRGPWWRRAGPSTLVASSAGERFA